MSAAELLLRAQSMLRDHGVSDEHTLMVSIEQQVQVEINRVLPLGIKGGRMTVDVIGKPKGQGNMVVGDHGKIVHRKDKALQTWRRLIANAVLRERAGAKLLPSRVPVAVGLLFRMPLPLKGKPGSKLAVPGEWHTLRGDFDKLTRAVLDALTGSVLTDDSQVVAWLPENGKRWCKDGESPGCSITLAQLS